MRLPLNFEYHDVKRMAHDHSMTEIVLAQENQQLELAFITGTFERIPASDVVTGTFSSWETYILYLYKFKATQKIWGPLGKRV